MAARSMARRNRSAIAVRALRTMFSSRSLNGGRGTRRYRVSEPQTMSRLVSITRISSLAPKWARSKRQRLDWLRSPPVAWCSRPTSRPELASSA